MQVTWKIDIIKKDKIKKRSCGSGLKFKALINLLNNSNVIPSAIPITARTKMKKAVESEGVISDKPAKIAVHTKEKSFVGVTPSKEGNPSFLKFSAICSELKKCS